MPGFVEELRSLRDVGLSAEEVLAAATSRAGVQLGLAPLGTLSDGARRKPRRGTR